MAVRTGWTEDEELEWETQVVYLSHHAQEATWQSEDTFASLQGLAARAHVRTTANARSYRVLTGMAICHRRAGRYVEAIAEYEAALDLIARLERTFSLASVHSHLAVCYQELGDVERQRQHADRALAANQTLEYPRMLAAYCAADAHQRLGNNRRAEQIIEEHDRELRSCTLPTSLFRLWLTCKADIAWMAGRKEAAYSLGIAAALAGDEEEQDRSSAGPVARWLAVVCAAGRWQGPQDRAILRVKSVQAVSWWEEAERLSALASLSQGLERERYLVDLGAAITRLPPTINNHLNRFGLSSPHRV
jgi:tetratricopeptide (TPR) repeat protein